MKDKGTYTASGKELTSAIQSKASKLKIVCPFIKASIIDRLLTDISQDIQVITRFNEADFVKGVSDVDALRKLLDADASVRGIKGLHTKLYIFDARKAVIASANLTNAALGSNHEFGVVTEDKEIVSSCIEHFDWLWQRGNDLKRDKILSWEEKLEKYYHDSVKGTRYGDLSDFGANVQVGKSNLTTIPNKTMLAEKPSFVKLLGDYKSKSLVSINTNTLDVIEDTGCNSALCNSPRGRLLKQVNDGDIMFISRMTRKPKDKIIFGYAIGKRHVPGQHIASKADIEQHEWKKKWSHYIFVHDAVFVSGTLKNGVSLNEMMDILGHDSFELSLRKKREGKSFSRPSQAYESTGGVKLSKEGFIWLNEKLQDAFNDHGTVPNESLDKFYSPKETNL